MSRRHLLAGGLVVLGLGLVAVVTGVVSAQADEVYEARASVQLAGSDLGGSDPFTWANREDVRIERHGERLVVAGGASSAGMRSFGVERNADRIEVRVRAVTSAGAEDLADRLIGVVGADLARTADPAVHDRLRAAELALGLPSPPIAIRPHSDDGVGARPTVADEAVTELVAARSAAVATLPPGTVQEAEGATRVAPNPARDAVEAVALVGLVAVLVLAGPPSRWRVLRSVPPPAAAGERRRRSLQPDVRLLPAVLWLWLLAPLARRVAEWAGIPSGRVLLALPALATLAVVPSLAAGGWPPGRHGRLAGWLAAPVALAVAVGVLENGWEGTAVGASSWVAPGLLALWAATVPDRPAVARAALDWLVLGAVLAGGYGVLQWATAPPWDTQWLASAGVGSFGQPEPFGLRAFGPFGAPSALGAFCAVALVVALWLPVRARPLVVVGSAGGLMLSLHRTSWLLAVVASAILLAGARRLAGRRLLAAVAVVAVVVAAGAAVPSVRDRVAGTIDDGFDDRSLGVRSDTYERLLPDLLTDPVGAGFGAVGAGAREATGFDPATDSTVLDVVLTFGAPAGLLVLGVLVVALVRARPRDTSDGSGPVLWALLLALAVTSPATNVLEGAAGVVTWTLAVLLLTSSEVPATDAEQAEVVP